MTEILQHQLFMPIATALGVFIGFLALLVATRNLLFRAYKAAIFWVERTWKKLMSPPTLAINSIVRRIYVWLSARAVQWEKEKMVGYLISRLQEDEMPDLAFFVREGIDANSLIARQVSREMLLMNTGGRFMAEDILSYLYPERWPPDQWNHWTVEKRWEVLNQLASGR